jgi:hypothetical protein
MPRHFRLVLCYYWKEIHAYIFLTYFLRKLFFKGNFFHSSLFTAKKKFFIALYCLLFSPKICILKIVVQLKNIYGPENYSCCQKISFQSRKMFLSKNETKMFEIESERTFSNDEYLIPAPLTSKQIINGTD